MQDEKLERALLSSPPSGVYICAAAASPASWRRWRRSPHWRRRADHWRHWHLPTTSEQELDRPVERLVQRLVTIARVLAHATHIAVRKLAATHRAARRLERHGLLQTAAARAVGQVAHIRRHAPTNACGRHHAVLSARAKPAWHWMPHNRRIRARCGRCIGVVAIDLDANAVDSAPMARDARGKAATIAHAKRVHARRWDAWIRSEQ